MHDDDLLVRCVVQRATHAEVIIEGKSQGSFTKGLVILFGIGFQKSQPEIPETDVPVLLNKFYPTFEKLAEKLISLRIFNDNDGKMNLSVKDIKGGLYLISQFTLFADCKKGNRPSFTLSARPYLAKPLYELFFETLQKKAEENKVLSGIFAANMQVLFCNDGPVTLTIEAGVKGIL
ncbi:D-aminoacyl-tRNA deacylase [Fluviispira multicolorata]|uniref:D-tyrosyl-tRNA(Tyr) deacylase n=1 Tax=Fluviispira multicolorata TaxID=2654512 RepID=A0A833N507_9BACT|nr:D-aminoacyl-tRNA deacylase [Fluviispira multicolorata]KAB8033367.1 D-tyrosyl-tRNA(Tyr) deacylase [Fluviispira multicolorata]